MKHIGIIKIQKFKRDALKKHWKIESESIQLITLQYVANCEHDAPFFKNTLNGKESISKGHTAHGFLPIELVTVSPDKLNKTVRTFIYTTEA